MKIKALRVPVGGNPTVVEIGNDLGSLQAEVGGYIERIVLGRGLDAYVNEEGMILGMDYNRTVVTPYGTIPVVGPMIVVSHDEEGETVGLTEDQIQRALRVLAPEQAVNSPRGFA